jgi:uncharacterized membrane protein YoaK (UPF0700 family)
VAIVGFVAATAGILGASDWWRAVAIAASLVSILGLLLFWARPATSPAHSALVFNLLVMGALWTKVEKSSPHSTASFSMRSRRP